MTRASFDTADFRLLIVFPSDVTVKGKSMTRDVINDFIRTKCPNVFVDFCYMPCEKDRKVFDKENMPYLIGNITHLDASHYDGIGFSLALNHEGMTAVSMLATCNRCDTPIPLTWSERRDLLVGEVPLIWCGGMAASVNDICFGELGDGRQAFFDFAVLGEIYCEKPMFEYLRQIKQHGGFTIQGAIRELWRMSRQYGEWDLYRHIYQPQAYRVIYDYTHTIVENSRIDMDAPEYCTPYRSPAIPTDLLGAARTIISGNGSNVNDARIMVARGCTGAGACSFCHEGNYNAGYVEMDRDTAVRMARHALAHTASDTFRPWAYNITSISHLPDSILQWRQMYRNVVFNNTRMDDLAGYPDLIREFARDNHHLYAPIEGISERIRNSLLNKGVFYHEIQSFFKYAAQLPVSICKVGFIYTGYEEDADWAEFRLMNREFNKLLQERSANFPLRYKGTMLVHYPHTPLYYMERKAARMSFEGRGVLTSPQFRKCLSEGIRIKMNGFKYGTFIEQAVLDLGRSLTSWAYTHYVARGIFIESFRSIRNCSEGFQALRDFINVGTFFSAKRVGGITPVSRIYLPNQPITLEKARDLVETGRYTKLTRRCLRGWGNVSPQCTACGICGDDVNFGCLSQRSLSDVKVGGWEEPAPKTEEYLIRVGVIRKVGYEALNPRHTVYTAIARLLQADEVLLNHFISIKAYSTQGMSGNGAQYPFRGGMYIDVAFSAKVLVQVRSAAQIVNTQSESFTIIKSSLIDKNNGIRNTDINRFQFESTMNHQLWEKCCRGYRGALLITEKGMRKVIYDSSLVAPEYTVNPNGKIVGYFTLPVSYSPWAYIQGIYTGHKISAMRIFENFQIYCMGIG